jgi:hypothetical protein
VPVTPTTPARPRRAAAHRPGRSWPRTLPALTRHLARTTPWATLLAGCLTGTLLLWLLRYHAHTSHTALDQNTMRLTVLPAIAALAFVPRTAFRPLIDTTPVPAWLIPAGQILLALPVLALTCWAQLLLIHPQSAPGVPAHPAASYPLLAQLTGWCALTVAVAACTDRSPYPDLGGAVAAPASLTLIALAMHGPETGRLLTTPPAAPHTTALAWYTITAAALALTCTAIRDRWHHYTRILSTTIHRNRGDP